MQNPHFGNYLIIIRLIREILETQTHTVYCLCFATKLLDRELSPCLNRAAIGGLDVVTSVELGNNLAVLIEKLTCPGSESRTWTLCEQGCYRIRRCNFSGTWKLPTLLIEKLTCPGSESRTIGLDIVTSVGLGNYMICINAQVLS